MKKRVLALACAAVILAPLAVANAQSVTALSGDSSAPTELNLGEIGTASPSLDTSGPSYLSSSGMADYYFEFLPPTSQATSYLGDLNFSGTVSSEVLPVGDGTALTASTAPGGSPVTTSFEISPGTEYELVVTGAANAPFVANVSAVSAAPEPATWAFTMLAIGMIGIALRRSKRVMRTTLVAA
jgi:hypothetical protein